MDHWPADFRGNLGEVIAVESSGHQRIGYLTGRRADKLWISQYHPEMESQKRWWNRFEDDERFTVGKIENIHTLSPPFLTPELVPQVGMALQYHTRDSIAVGYVARITHSKIIFDLYEPQREKNFGLLSRLDWQTTYTLPDLNLAAKRASIACR